MEIIALPCCLSPQNILVYTCRHFGRLILMHYLAPGASQSCFHIVLVDFCSGSNYLVFQIIQIVARPLPVSDIAEENKHFQLL